MLMNLSIFLFSNSHNLPIMLTGFTHYFQIMLDLMLMAVKTTLVSYFKYAKIAIFSNILLKNKNY